MDLITCSECGKHYDYDKEEFCPKCGVYNPSHKHMASMRARTSDRRPAANRPAPRTGYAQPQRGYRQEAGSPRQSDSRRGRQGRQKGGSFSQVILVLVILYFIIAFLLPILRIF